MVTDAPVVVPLWLRVVGGLVLGILGVSLLYAGWIALQNLDRIGV